MGRKVRRGPSEKRVSELREHEAAVEAALLLLEGGEEDVDLLLSPGARAEAPILLLGRIGRLAPYDTEPKQGRVLSSLRLLGLLVQYERQTAQAAALVCCACFRGVALPLDPQFETLLLRELAFLSWRGTPPVAAGDGSR